MLFRQTIRQITAASPRWDAVLPPPAQERYRLLDGAGEALDWRLRAIESAERSIDLQTFLWAPDTAGSAVAEHLVAAAARGVRIRHLVDDSFLSCRDQLALALGRRPGIELRVFNPYARRATRMAVRMALNLAEFGRLDHRMHNKPMVVDGGVAIVGGRNLADEYFGLHAESNFRDLDVLGRHHRCDGAAGHRAGAFLSRSDQELCSR